MEAKLLEAVKNWYVKTVGALITRVIGLMLTVGRHNYYKSFPRLLLRTNSNFIVHKISQSRVMSKVHIVREKKLPPLFLDNFGGLISIPPISMRASDEHILSSKP